LPKNGAPVVTPWPPNKSGGASPTFPPFTRIAADPRWAREALIHMMTVPHIQMPPPVLTRAEAEDVAAYILSLRK